jgi:hypothetical protein
MKLILTCFLFLGFLATGQQTTDALIEQIIRISPRSVEKYTAPKKDKVLALETSFNNAVYKDAAALNSLRDKVIVKVELVYTTYRKSETFDQHGLNRKRLKTLMQAAPDILTQAGIEWVLIAQTGCTSAEDGPNFFHGVVITYRDRPNNLMTQIELKYLEKVFDGSVPAHAYDAFVRNELKNAKPDSTGQLVIEKEYKLKEPKFPGTDKQRIDYFTRNLKFPPTVKKMDQRVAVQFTVDKTGKIKDVVLPEEFADPAYREEVKKFVERMPNWEPGSVDGKPGEFLVQFTVDYMSRGSVVPSPIKSYSTEIPAPKEDKNRVDYSKIKPGARPKLVIDALARNKWSNYYLVMDITGSMAQYNAQLFEYLRQIYAQKDTSIRGVVMFNDGDGRSDKSKKIGQVGGIYQLDKPTLDDLLNKMMTAMAKGDGGDTPENNVEALLVAQSVCPNCDQLVMLADNAATPRDLKLLDQVLKPVQIIVCGSSNALNENYLTIAYKTKGCVEFNGKRYSDLHTFEEGATVQVGKEVYVLKGGKFERRLGK